MSLAPRNYSDLAGRTMRLAMCFVPANLGALDTQRAKQSLMLLAQLCNDNRLHSPTPRRPHRMKAATAKDYEAALTEWLAAIREWRDSKGLP